MKFFIILTLLLALGLSLASAIHQSNQCRDSGDVFNKLTEQLHGLYTTDKMMDATFPYSIRTLDQKPVFSQISIHIFRQMCDANRTNFMENLRAVLGDGNPSIDYKQSGKNALSTRSVCPSLLKSNYDPARFPETIPEAHCLCDSCAYEDKFGGFIQRHTSATQNSSGGTRRTTFTTGRCREMKTPMYVFRKLCDYNTGVYEYTLDKEMISVGCTCGFPAIL